MGKLETAFREEALRLARKVNRAAQAAVQHDLRRLKERVRSLQAEVAQLRTATASEHARFRMEKAAMGGDAARQVRISPQLIKKLRRKLKVSQPEFARLLGVSLSSIGFWESGKVQPRQAMKLRIAALRRLGRRDIRRMLAAPAKEE